MPTESFRGVDLSWLAERVGTPFYLYDSNTLSNRLDAINSITASRQLQARYAMKACSVRRVLEVVREAGLWIDAVSGNEILRAQAAGYNLDASCPEVMLTTDVFRDNAVDVICKYGVLPNIGSPAMLNQLVKAGYQGPIALRLNPGFGHGHVESCDTGGPSSKHGLWYEQAPDIAQQALHYGLPTVLLHAHVGSGPTPEEFIDNMQALVQFFAQRLSAYPNLEAINLGGGIPYPYRLATSEVDLQQFGTMLRQSQIELSCQYGRDLRLEIEPGRYVIAQSGCLISRVTDIKRTADNAKGRGHVFVMLDAGFCDLARPAMYGAYHHITVWQSTLEQTAERVVMAGPLCESGDVFTRDSEEFLQPRTLPRVQIGDLVIIHDAGAYGTSMSSNYNSIGRAPQIWWENDRPYLISRRETFEDLVRTECFTPL
jgi:diaminopimelate decarboxylase